MLLKEDTVFTIFVWEGLLAFIYGRPDVSTSKNTIMPKSMDKTQMV